MTYRMKMRVVSNELSYNFSILLILYDVLPSQIDKNQYLHLQKSIFLIVLSYILNKFLKLYDISEKNRFLCSKNVIYYKENRQFI